MQQNLLNELGELALGSRLKRLSDYIFKEGKEVYGQNNIDFEPRWFPTFYTLSNDAPLTVVEIADRIGFTHAAVSQTVRELKQAGFLVAIENETDKRKRDLQLSQKGKALFDAMKPLWSDIASALNDLLRSHRNHLMAALQEIENSFEEKSFTERIRDTKNTRLLNEVEIIPYQSDCGYKFKELNIEWLEKYFYVEDIDNEVLGKPEEYILKKGGDILFAKLNGSIVGTCALLKYNNDKYEMTKMAVTEKVQGKQVGKKLGLAIIDRAKELGAKKVVLESNKILTPALTLYERLGFKYAHKDFSTSAYARANVYMELELR